MIYLKQRVIFEKFQVFKKKVCSKWKSVRTKYKMEESIFTLMNHWNVERFVLFHSVDWHFILWKLQKPGIGQMVDNQGTNWPTFHHLKMGSRNQWKNFSHRLWIWIQCGLSSLSLPFSMGDLTCRCDEANSLWLTFLYFTISLATSILTQTHSHTHTQFHIRLYSSKRISWVGGNGIEKICIFNQMDVKMNESTNERIDEKNKRTNEQK